MRKLAVLWARVGVRSRWPGVVVLLLLAVLVAGLLWWWFVPRPDKCAEFLETRSFIEDECFAPPGAIKPGSCCDLYGPD